MKIVIEAWKDHHIRWVDNPKKNLYNLMNMIYNGELSWQKDSTHDEKVTITIETEDEN